MKTNHIVIRLALFIVPLAMFAALTAMIIGKILAGIPVDVIVSTIFVIISLAGIVLGIVILGKIREEPVKLTIAVKGN